MNYNGFQSEVDTPMKRSRRSVTLQQKLEIINRMELGQRAVDVGKAMGMPATTVRSIFKSATKIRESAKRATPLSSKKITRKRSDLMEQMEKLVADWIDETLEAGSALTQAMIMARAKNIFDELKRFEPSGSAATDETFQASRGWFDRFRKRQNLCNVGPTGSITRGEDLETSDSYNGLDEPKVYMSDDAFYVKPEPQSPDSDYLDDSTGNDPMMENTDVKMEDMFVSKLEIQSNKDIVFADNTIEEGSLLVHDDEVSNYQLENKIDRSVVGREEICVDDLNKVFSLIDEASEILKKKDPSHERSSLVTKSLNESVSVYKEMYRKRKQNKKHMSLGNSNLEFPLTRVKSETTDEHSESRLQPTSTSSPSAYY
ncbi:PREDICTED: uncharacterized protein LOC108566903 isoform X3 [Nicrophorus vespilloides]|uniref:Uncharacterized protein LOC108566903 isoform X3 n=1 Tax=Nicrophorus vespilloides TaxID=110193 RepID=A0ABM1N6R4_NICVS|nr:PREDICTED: uncharacterized protein LOC108566903 isoform X3 [Nicrophorus vespilloides]